VRGQRTCLRQLLSSSYERLFCLNEPLPSNPPRF
jgi:hypothetical protein